MDDVGPYVSRGAAISFDNYLPQEEIFKVLFVTAGGSIRVEGIDGQEFTVQAQDNSAVYVFGRRVRSVGTTATGITWGGGV